MTMDLEQRLSERLHSEAQQLAPDRDVPPLPDPVRRFRALSRDAGSRWRAPALAAAAVVAIAAVTAVVVAQQQNGTATPAAGGATGAASSAQSAPTSYPGRSPILDNPAPSFDCAGTPTTQAARTPAATIGVTSIGFCLTVAQGHQVAGTDLMGSGPLRAWLGTESAVGGAVDHSVDGVTWIPAGGDESSAATLDLYALGTLRGFALPGQSSGGTLVLYSGATVLARQQVPGWGAGRAAASSSPAPVQDPAAGAGADPSGGSVTAQRSYPPGQGPTPKPGAWPTNARGQTYGSDANANAQTGEPDLIAAYATNGKEGYVLRTDVDGQLPTSISQALAQNSAPDRTIPVYESDGVTQIGVFVIQGGNVVVDAGTETASPTR